MVDQLAITKADNYLVNPLGMAELPARLRAGGDGSRKLSPVHYRWRLSMLDCDRRVAFFTSDVSQQPIALTEKSSNAWNT